VKAMNDNSNDDLENVAIIRDSGMTLVTQDDCMPITVGQRLTTFAGTDCYAVSGRAPIGRGSGLIAIKLVGAAIPVEVLPGAVKARWIDDATLDALLAAAGEQLH